MIPFQKISCVLLVCFFFAGAGKAVADGGIRGRVTGPDNNGLAYASISVKGTGTGTLSNADGYFDLQLEPGSYEIHFQFLGYKTGIRQVQVAGESVTLNVRLEEQPLHLKELQVGKGIEDPAATIMRKAIAKAKFHQLQIQSYTSSVYTKSTALPTRIPTLLKNRLKKQGIREGIPFVNETVTEVSYKRPNTYSQKVVSTRNNVDNNTPTPNEFIFASFYSPEISGTVTPLSPRAFASYRFEYEGFFEDRGEIVNKIKVIPKTYKEGVFKGSIYILEDRWAIHSLDLQTMRQGFEIHVKQVFSPVENVWVAGNQHFQIRGSYLGFAGQFTYVVSVRYKSIAIDPRLRESVELIDHKLDKASALLETAKKISGDKEKFSTRNFRKIVKAYEKETREKEQTPPAKEVRRDEISIEPLATRRDSTYWESSRTVPLTALEVKGYAFGDSVAAEKQRTGGPDTTSFKAFHLLTGARYRYRHNTSLTLFSPLQSLYYNPAETFALHVNTELQRKFNNGLRFQVAPLLHYSFGRHRLSPSVSAGISGDRQTLTLSGGEQIRQFNSQDPVPQTLNTVAYLLFNRNYLRLYQHRFVNIQYGYRNLFDVLSFSGAIEYGSRSRMQVPEHTRRLLFGNPRLPRNSNDPDHLEQTGAGYGDHKAALLSLALTVKPWQRYRVRNGRKIYFRNGGPEFSLRYRKGLALAGGQAEYDYLEGALRYNLKLTPASDLSFAFSGGKFLRTGRLYFHDFRHFAGNRMLLQTGEVLDHFRALPYYRYSTGNRFIEGHLSWDSRKFLLTRFPVLRFAGLKEYLQFHFLNTPAAGFYSEQVYGLDGLLRLFRAEVATSFRGSHYNGLVFRIGTTLPFR